MIGGSRGFEPFSRLWREQCTFGAFGQNGHIFPNGERLNDEERYQRTRSNVYVAIVVS